MSPDGCHDAMTPTQMASDYGLPLPTSLTMLVLIGAAELTMAQRDNAAMGVLWDVTMASYPQSPAAASVDH